MKVGRFTSLKKASKEDLGPRDESDPRREKKKYSGIRVGGRKSEKKWVPKGYGKKFKKKKKREIAGLSVECRVWRRRGIKSRTPIHNN